MIYGFFFVIFVVVVILFFYGRHSAKKRIDDIFLGNADGLGMWRYTPEEWKTFSEDYFPWVENKDSAGILFISHDEILISNRQGELLLNLAYQYLLVDIEYDDSSSVFHIKLKKLLSDYKGIKTYDEYCTELSIPLPPGNAEKANRVIEQVHQAERERSANLQSDASKDLVFAQFLNSPTDEDKPDNSQ